MIGGLTGGSSTIAGSGGGGLFNLNGTLNLVQSTIIDNLADDGDDIYTKATTATGGVPAQAVVITVANSILGAVIEDHEDVPNTQSTVTFPGKIATLTYVELSNGDGTDTLLSAEYAAASVITSTDPFVSSTLADNGGLTRTLALIAGGEAVDVGTNGAAIDPVSEAALEFDQRGDGFFRIGNGTVDVGAFEVQAAPPLPTVSVTATSPTSDETAGTNLQLQFTRTGSTSQELVVTVAFELNGFTLDVDAGTEIVSGGTLNREDLSAVTLTFADGSDTVTVTLPVTDDIHAEADESITATIGDQAGILVGQQNAATVTITQNDFVVINANNAGEGSLRQAILNAEALAGADTVTFVEALDGATIPLTTNDGDRSYGPTAFSIRTDVTIRGSGQIITRDVEASAFRFFYVFSSGSLTLENLELNDGLALGGSGTGGGGGAAGLGGAIFNRGQLAIRNSTLVENFAQGGHAGAASGGGGGGGLGGDGQIGPDGAGGGVNGGAGGSEGIGQDGGFGGGGGASGEPATGGNGGFGGGFGGGAGASFISGTPGFGVIPSGELDSLPEGGAAFGGAIFNYEGSVLLVNSTITGNTARGGNTPTANEGFNQPGYGGGLFNLRGSVEVRNSTFAGNRADVGGSLYNLSSETGASPDPDAFMELYNSIFVDSVLSDGSADSADEVHNFVEGVEGGTAAINAASPNITNGGGFVNESGDLDDSGVIEATAPVVAGTLADNGGPTRTLRLLAGSAAIDAGDNDEAVDPPLEADLEFDQRGEGFPRIVNDAVDLGAFESAIAGIPETIVITSLDFVVVQNGPQGGPEVGDPFPDFHGENLVAVGDVNDDGIVDFIFSAGNFGGPRVQVISGADGSVLHNFFAYDRDFRGGVYIATGDLDGDGHTDIVTGAGMLGGPHVRAFSGKDGSVLANFFAYDSGHRSGVTVAVGDINGDGRLDIITGSGPGDGSEIRIFDGSKLDQPDALLASLFPYETGYRDGVFVAAGNLDGDQFADLVAGPLTTGGTTQAVVFTGATLAKINTFFENEPSLFVGIRFTIADANGDGIDDMVVVAANGGGPRRIVVNPLTGEQIDNSFFDDEDVRSAGYGVG